MVTLVTNRSHLGVPGGDQGEESIIMSWRTELKSIENP